MHSNISGVLEYIIDLGAELLPPPDALPEGSERLPGRPDRTVTIKVEPV